MTTTTMQSLFSLATIVNTTNFDDNGSFWAEIDALGNGMRLINYTSPYSSRTEGGFISIPEEGTRILVCRPSGDSRYFFVGATFLPELDGLVVESTDQITGGAMIQPDKPLMRVDKNLYRMRGKPMKMAFKGVRGNGLVISEEYSQAACNIKTELIGQSGKCVQINDSPEIDCILLRNEHNDGIKITTSPKSLGLPARAIEIESHGPQKYINRESQTDIMVWNGRELNILNHSNGANRNPDEPLKFGNINLESKHHDINLMTRKDSGRIFIKCINTAGDNQVIDIETKAGTGSTIRVKSTGKLELIAEGSRGMDIVSGGEINLKAASNINIDSGGSINLLSSGQVNVDGSKTYLQTGLANPSNDDISAQYTGYYEAEGIYP